MEYFRLEFRLTMNGKTHHETIRNNTLNQIESLAKRFCHADALPFKKYFSAEEFAETLKNLALKGKNRVYPPVVTLSAFISQVLSPDGCCRDAVARVRAELSSQGEKPCSADTSPYQQHGSRASDFRRGKRLGSKDHLVIWTKPTCPDWMDAETYLDMPDTLTVREFKSSGIIIVTTMLDPKEAPRKEIASFYTQRWLVEVDLRAIKETLKMDMLRCKTPEMIHKEIAVHFIAYNLIRTVMAQAADLKGIAPRTISFKGTVQTLNAYRDAIRLVNEKMLPTIIGDLLNAVAGHRVGNRPGRSEPRAVKRRPKSHPLLTVPRSQAA